MVESESWGATDYLFKLLSDLVEEKTNKSKWKKQQQAAGSSAVSPGRR